MADLILVRDTHRDLYHITYDHPGRDWTTLCGIFIAVGSDRGWLAMNATSNGYLKEHASRSFCLECLAQLDERLE